MNFPLFLYPDRAVSSFSSFFPPLQCPRLSRPALFASSRLPLSFPHRDAPRFSRSTPLWWGCPHLLPPLASTYYNGLPRPVLVPDALMAFASVRMQRPLRFRGVSTPRPFRSVDPEVACYIPLPPLIRSLFSSFPFFYKCPLPLLLFWG